MNHIAAPSVAFIFDCDGTLVNSSPVWGHAQTELLRRHGIDVTVDDFAQFEHLSLEDECQAYHDTWGIGTNGEALYRPELLDDPQHFGIDAYVDNFKSHCTACKDMERRFLAAPYPVEKLDFYFVDSAERAKYLARVQDVRAWVVPCESAGVEINAIGTDKGSGLQALCRCLNIPISATIAIGDSENDRPLLRDAGLPLAMGNAIADVKAAARYVMPDCDHDGVAEAIERFLLAQS